MGWGVGDRKSGQNRKPHAFLKSQRKIKNELFFDFFGPDFFGPEIGPRNFGRVESAPSPTRTLGTSGPGRVGDENDGQNRKPDVFLKSQRKKIFNFFLDFFGPDFFEPEIWQSRGWRPP